MTRTKLLVYLANSDKPGGRCVAGIDIAQGAGSWIRPVGHRAGRAVSDAERCYVDGSEPQVLDIVEVHLRAPQPVGFQRENWLLDTRARWRKVGHLGQDDLDLLADQPGSLWLTGPSTNSGINDRVPEQANRRSRIRSTSSMSTT
ncbi:dual OB domain-containing protein [Amycolatopsis sp. NPDC051903]|uniref:dual OB domain-containing protein n=1 Tax=Amycolatopsis sp. NPDC051903 TaxID=3363936 RepID=UPI0037907B5D